MAQEGPQSRRRQSRQSCNVRRPGRSLARRSRHTSPARRSRHTSPTQSRGHPSLARTAVAPVSQAPPPLPPPRSPVLPGPAGTPSGPTQPGPPWRHPVPALPVPLSPRPRQPRYSSCCRHPGVPHHRVIYADRRIEVRRRCWSVSTAVQRQRPSRSSSRRARALARALLPSTAHTSTTPLAGWLM